MGLTERKNIYTCDGCGCAQEAWQIPDEWTRGVFDINHGLSYKVTIYFCNKCMPRDFRIVNECYPKVLTSWFLKLKRPFTGSCED